MAVCSEPRCTRESSVVAITRAGDIPVCHEHAEELAGRRLERHHECEVDG